jgi:hypothetical protein
LAERLCKYIARPHLAAGRRSLISAVNDFRFAGGLCGRWIAATYLRFYPLLRNFSGIIEPVLHRLGHRKEEESVPMGQNVGEVAVRVHASMLGSEVANDEKRFFMRRTILFIIPGAGHCIFTHFLARHTVICYKY